MRSACFALCAALFGSVAISVPASAQEAGAEDVASSAICTFHGEGCAAPASEWTWERLEPRVGVYSVELPCNSQQANAFGQLLANSRAPFEAGSTRACMKAAAGFTAALVGFAGLPDGAVPPEAEQMLQGEPDMFSVFVRQVARDQEIPVISVDGRRTILNNLENDNGYSRVAIIEVSQFGILVLNGNIRTGLGVTRAEGDALFDRFFDSLEFVE